MKYIILRLDGKIPREVPVIFPDLLVHADVARTMATTIKEDSSNTNIYRHPCGICGLLQYRCGLLR
ncbi:hypothetical protein AAE121_005240 [Salmonella enterica]